MLLELHWEVQLDVQYTEAIHEVHQPTSKEAELPKPHRDGHEDCGSRCLVLSGT